MSSRPFGCFLKPVASMFQNSDSGAGLLSFKRKDLIWVSILLFVFFIIMRFFLLLFELLFLFCI